MRTDDAAAWARSPCAPRREALGLAPQVRRCQLEPLTPGGAARIFARRARGHRATNPIGRHTGVLIERHRIEEILHDARGVRVAVVGDCMLDVYLSGHVHRISPEAPVPVVHVTEERAAPGGAANVAMAVRALRAECELAGVIGSDPAGATLVEQLQNAGVGTRYLLTAADRFTTTKTRVMARHHHVVRFDRESEADLAGGLARQLSARTVQALDWAEALVLEDYNKGVLVSEVIEASVRAARARGIPCVADPKFRNFFGYRGAHVFKPNAIELAAAFGLPAAPRDPERLWDARERLGCTYLLLTLGEEGMILAGPDREVHDIPGVPRDVFDVSGAGDTVTATVAVCLAAGATELEAAIVANYAASMEVGKAGIVPVTSEEILEAYDTERLRRESLLLQERG